jgi:acetyl esterase/lipase
MEQIEAGRVSSSRPFVLLFPLMDDYASPERAKNIANPLLHPILADDQNLPRKMLIFRGRVDILLNEERTFVERLEDETEVLYQRIKSSIHGKGLPVDE